MVYSYVKRNVCCKTCGERDFFLTRFFFYEDGIVDSVLVREIIGRESLYSAMFYTASKTTFWQSEE